MKHLALSAPALLALACPLLAGGFDRARVPAKAHAVAHVDLEALLRSKLLAEVQRMHPDFKADLDLGEASPFLRGVQPLKDIRSVTVFATDLRQERFGLLLHASDKVEALLNMATAVEQYSVQQVGGRSVHSWSDDEDGGERVLAALFEIGGSTDKLVLASNDPELMAEGMAVLEGRAASLATTGGGLVATQARAGAIAFAACDQSLGELGDLSPSSPVARMVQGLVLQVGENGGNVFMNLALRTEDYQNAQRVQQVLQGLTALASLGIEGLDVEDLPQRQVLQRLVAGLRFTSYANELTVEFEYGLQALIDDLQLLEESH